MRGSNNLTNSHQQSIAFFLFFLWGWELGGGGAFFNRYDFRSYSHKDICKQSYQWAPLNIPQVYKG